MSAERKFEPGRYRKGDQTFLDSDMEMSGGIGIYNNHYQVYDRDKATGIWVGEDGSTKLKTRTITITFGEHKYPLLRQAIFAYEDSLSRTPDAEEKTR